MSHARSTEPRASRPDREAHGEVIGRSAAGCLAFCSGCRHFTLEFGPMCLELSSGEVAELQCHLAEMLHEHVPAVDGFQRFQIRFDGSRAGLRLYSDEAFELRQLLEHGAEYLDETAAAPRSTVH